LIYGGYPFWYFERIEPVYQDIFFHFELVEKSTVEQFSFFLTQTF